MGRYLIGNVKGPKGDDGISPTAEVIQTEDGATIRITDKSGATTATIKNGRSGNYEAGDNIKITGNVISATDTKYTAGENIVIDGNNRISALGGSEAISYTAGNGILITGNEISSTVTVPTKVSAFENDSNFITKPETLELVNKKQDALTAGENITIENNTISAKSATYTAGTGLYLDKGTFAADTTILATKADIAGKQDTLTAGDNITIEDGVISAANTTYTAGTGIAIENGAISSTIKVPRAVSELTNDSNYVNKTELDSGLAGKQNVLTPGANITIENGVISSTASGGVTYTAGAGISIANDTISVDGTVALKNELFSKDYNDLTNKPVIPDISNLATTEALTAGLATKQNTLTAGDNITIENNVISAASSGTTYTAGQGITIDENNVISATGGSGSIQIDNTTIINDNGVYKTAIGGGALPSIDTVLVNSASASTPTLMNSPSYFMHVDSQGQPVSGSSHPSIANVPSTWGIKTGSGILVASWEVSIDGHSSVGTSIPYRYDFSHGNSTSGFNADEWNPGMRDMDTMPYFPVDFYFSTWSAEGTETPANGLTGVAWSGRYAGTKGEVTLTKFKIVDRDTQNILIDIQNGQDMAPNTTNTDYFKMMDLGLGSNSAVAFDTPVSFDNGQRIAWTANSTYQGQQAMKVDISASISVSDSQGKVLYSYQFTDVPFYSTGGGYFYNWGLGPDAFSGAQAWPTQWSFSMADWQSFNGINAVQFSGSLSDSEKATISNLHVKYSTGGITYIDSKYMPMGSRDFHQENGFWYLNGFNRISFGNSSNSASLFLDGDTLKVTINETTYKVNLTAE